MRMASSICDLRASLRIGPDSYESLRRKEVELLGRAIARAAVWRVRVPGHEWAEVLPELIDGTDITRCRSGRVRPSLDSVPYPSWPLGEADELNDRRRAFTIAGRPLAPRVRGSPCRHPGAATLLSALLLVAIAAAGTALRLWQLDAIGFNSDEAVYAGQAAAIAADELKEIFPIFRLSTPVPVRLALAHGRGSKRWGRGSSPSWSGCSRWASPSSSAGFSMARGPASSPRCSWRSCRTTWSCPGRSSSMDR